MLASPERCDREVRCKTGAAPATVSGESAATATGPHPSLPRKRGGKGGGWEGAAGDDRVVFIAAGLPLILKGDPISPSPPFRGEREGPAPKVWEGEVGVGEPSGIPLTPTLSPDGGEGE